MLLCRKPSDASCALIGKLCSYLNDICICLFIIFHSDQGRRVSHMDATMHKLRNMVAEAWSVLMRNGESRQFWDYVEYCSDKADDLAKLTVSSIERKLDRLRVVLPDVIRLVYKREPVDGEVGMLVERAGSAGIEACMGDHAKNEQNRHAALERLLGKEPGSINSFGCAACIGRAGMIEADVEIAQCD